MRFDWWTLGLQTINFAVLVWLLHRFLYKPVLRVIEGRRGEIEKQYADAHAASVRAKDELAAIEVQRVGIAAEREAELEATVAQADRLAGLRRDKAEAEARALLEGARKALATERDKALADMRKAALDLGTEIASRLLADVPAKLRAEAWLDPIEDYLAALPKPQLDELVHQFEDGAVLTIVTAWSLAPEITDRWRNRLHRPLGDGTTIAFAVDPKLIAGAELHFPTAVLRFSWQSALAAVRAEIETR
jgi:F-type H+-transporting ATPase subunit b